jgi:hypothetical protein
VRSGRGASHGWREAQTTRRRSSFLLVFARQFSVSHPKRYKAKASVSELALGVVKIWKPGESMRLSLDRSPGMYATAGIFWASGLGDLPVVFNFGFEAKYLVETDIELFGVEADADYKQLSVQLGLGW